MEKPLRSIILLNKPAGPTSLECAERVCRILSAKKSGHAGTLDPGVTGVLIVALDEATKAMPVLMGLEKTYEGVMHVHRDFSESELIEAMNSFKGKIIQKPPVRSAVSRMPREREIYSFEILKISGRDVHFRVKCQAGTYIRKLCSDLGEKMNTQAHMKSLVRTKAGPFSLKECAALENLEKNPKKHMISLEAVFQRIGVKRVFVKENSARKVLNGSPVFPSQIERKDNGIRENEYVGIFLRTKLIALGLAKGRLVKTERIFKAERGS